MSGEQESESGVLVAVRTRPTTSFAHDELVVEPQMGKLTVQPPPDHVFSRSTGERATPGGAAQAPSQMFFQFDSVLHNSRQETVYQAVASDIVNKTTQGISGAIMAYGQTGSGKTYTMIGDMNNYTNRGIAPRALSQIFDAIDNRPDMEYHVEVSYMEIYNEQIHDLLKAEDVPEPDYVLGEDNTYGVIVKGLSRHTVRSEQEALNALFTGEIHRTTAQHKLNRNSNRSHCIFTVYMDQRSRVGFGEKTIYSKLHLVDLAGSERIKKTMHIPDNEKLPRDKVITKESMFINKSLSYLEQCVLALTRKGQEYVPYRQTRLTNVLKDALSGYCNTAFVGCIWGESSHLEETISTLRLAARMRRIRVHTQQAYSLNPELLARKYEKQIEELKQELAMHNALSERSTIKYDEYSPEQQQELRRKLQNYLESAESEEEQNEIQLESVRQMRELLKQMKILYKEMRTEMQDRVRTQESPTDEVEASEGAKQRESSPQPRTTKEGQESSQQEDGGTLDETAGVSVGLADAKSRPVRELAGPLKHSSGAAAQINNRMRSQESASRTETNVQTEEAPSHVNMDDSNEAFKWYRSADGPGHELAQSLISLRSEYRSAKSEAKEAAKQVNEQASKIKSLQDELKEVAEEESKERAESKEQMADNAEYEKAAELSKAKEEYKRCQRSLQESKDKVHELDEAITNKHAQLLQQFDAWYEYHTGFSATGGAANVSLSRSAGGEASSPFDTSMMFAMGSSAPEGRTSPYRAKASVLASAGSAPGSPTGSPSRSRRSPERHQAQGLSSTAANLASIGKLSSVKSPGGEVKQEDALDEGEAFEKMEMERIAAGAPDSVAYYQARKRMQSSMREAMSSGQPLHGRRRRQQLASS